MIHSEAELAAYVCGDWYENASGLLYVLPAGDLEPQGEDGEVLAFLAHADRDAEKFARWCLAFGVVVVPHRRRGWSARRGFYVIKEGGKYWLRATPTDARIAIALMLKTCAGSISTPTRSWETSENGKQTTSGAEAARSIQKSLAASRTRVLTPSPASATARPLGSVSRRRHGWRMGRGTLRPAPATPSRG